MGKVAFDLTIPNGATVSNALGRNNLRFGESLTIFPPATLGTAGTVSVKVTRKMAPVTADWVDLQSSGVDVTLLADKAVVLVVAPFMGLRIESASDPGADLIFGVVISDEL